MGKSHAVLFIGLIVNSMAFPGVGSIIAGVMKQGIVQAVLFIIGVSLAVIGFRMADPIAGLVTTMIGSFMVLIAWVWGIATSIIAVRKKVTS